MRGSVAIAAALALGAGLGGCVNLSRSAPVTPLAPEVARSGRVTEVMLADAPRTVSSEFEAIFRRRVQAKLDGCALGQRPLRLEATVARLTRTNPVVTAVVAGANVLRGSARLVDVETGAPAGEYQIGRTVVGGRIAALVMAEAEEQLSDAFGDELCKQAFSGTGGPTAGAAAPAAPGQAAPETPAAPERAPLETTPAAPTEPPSAPSSPR